AWTISPVSAPPGAALSAVTATASDNVWAAGQYSAPDGSLQPLFEHWDGTAWTEVTEGAGTEDTGGIIYGISALSSTDAWAVGSKGDPVAFDLPLTEHWDGTSWTVMDAPSPEGETFAVLHSVADAGSEDATAVGGTSAGLYNDRWNGTAW